MTNSVCIACVIKTAYVNPKGNALFQRYRDFYQSASLLLNYFGETASKQYNVCLCVRLFPTLVGALTFLHVFLTFLESILWWF